MTKKPATRHRDAVQALNDITDPAERARAAGDLGDAMRDTAPDVARIRQDAIKELRAKPLSYRAIGELLNIHHTRVRQIELGEATGKWKKPASAQEPTAED